MTLVSQIIVDAYRETNIIPMGVTPNANQQTEALQRLNNILQASIGNEIGDTLTDINIGPPYDQTVLCVTFIPRNCRLQFNQGVGTNPGTLKLHPIPFEGQRLSVVDVAGNFGTYPLTLVGNGRQIEGQSQITINTNNDNRTWVYIGDQGGWVKITNLSYTDTMPFPQKFDEYFTLMLATRLNPRYGQNLSPETVEAMKRWRSQLRGYYHAWMEIQTDIDTRGYLTDSGAYTNLNSSEFNTGRPYPWR